MATLIPDHETSVDLLNYEAISRTIVEVLRTNHARPLTIGVHGDWGAGKSSVLKMVEQGLTDDKDVACLWFNGWTFQGFDDAKTVLIETVVDELQRRRSSYGKVKDISGRLLARLDWLKIARRAGGLGITALTGVPTPETVNTVLGSLEGAVKRLRGAGAEGVESALEEAAGLLKAPEPVSVPEEMHFFREDFEELLREAQIEQLVVLIDDLDRCLPATAIGTLEAIRLFLFVPKTAFVIAADEAMIEYSVQQHFPELPASSGPATYARNYLEKLVQVPFRIPSLGAQETRTYVSLLLVQSQLGEDHTGFQNLLETARNHLLQPWLSSGLTQGEVEQAAPDAAEGLRAAYILGEQIGPTLAEGTRGNPRQIKRFLNSLLLRRSIANALGFSDQINQAVLAKLMLAERFATDFYESLAGLSMSDPDGRVGDLAWLEDRQEELEAADEPEPPKGKRKPRNEPRKERPEHVARWLEHQWLKSWARLEPKLADVDLRPYVFVARDKRLVLSGGAGLSKLEALVERLMRRGIGVRSAESEVKGLSAADAERVFGMLRVRVLRADLSAEPPGFEGLRLLVKHHPKLQTDLTGLLAGVEPRQLGAWVVRGWGEALTEAASKEQLRALMVEWAKREDNALLKRAAGQALASMRRA